MSRHLLTAVALTVAPALAPANSEAFAKVKPVLAQHCVKCHGGERLRADLNLTTLDGVLAGGRSGPVVRPGKAEQSLIVRVLAPDHKPHMPPQGQLTETEQAAVRDWINSLEPAVTRVAPPKEPDLTDADRRHWAFQPVKRPPPPAVRHADQVRTPVDAFLLAALEKDGRHFAPPADARTLARRASFALTGLPPSPEELDAFLRDAGPDAFDKFVDKLLASPHYGEKWGRHWLDLARYADSDGGDADTDRPDAWRYRDYVVRSFNADKPYDRFVREQIAGDEIAPPDADAVIATGFCRCGAAASESDGEQGSLNERDDALSTACTVILGVSVGCARCHDHKYDPVSQRDYFRMLATFAAAEKRDTPVPSDDDRRRYDRDRPVWKAELAKIQAEIAQLPPAAEDGDDRPKMSYLEAEKRRRRQELEQRLEAHRRKAPKLPAAMTIADTGPVAPPTWLLVRGDPKTPADEVEPGVPRVLAGLPIRFGPPSATSTNRRTALAEWLTSPANPLTARVMVNRLWHYHFGRGIVATPGNFGVAGDPPSHPELLDWLADEFVQRGWSVKAMHKLILTSAAYRQSSTDPVARSTDPDNLKWGYFPLRRLDAESIRDAMLAASGKLNRTPGGPAAKLRPVDAETRPSDGPQQWRRSIYTFIKRTDLHPLLESFDAPKPVCSCDARPTTTVPTQALHLLNGPFVREQASFLAQRVAAEAGRDSAKRVDRLFALTVGRRPGDGERARAVAFLQSQEQEYRKAGRRSATKPDLAALADLGHVAFNLNEFVYVD